MDYQQYQAAYQPMGYNSYHHYQYATPANHLKVRTKHLMIKISHLSLFQNIWYSWHLVLKI